MVAGPLQVVTFVSVSREASTLEDSIQTALETQVAGKPICVKHFGMFL